ncbi:hypothetical protein B0T20DRAFT_26112 [Sordaria brevicollis]|uniref:Uncharacterized protein n=1 Tax=Sordaria brevicollis TaxID=83679 RepID=A0AAE0PPA4_SORBR|nr:hypothetical protein B0T20DRAFT_26112 [Sordaria brevicollis]
MLDLFSVNLSTQILNPSSKLPARLRAPFPLRKAMDTESHTSDSHSPHIDLSDYLPDERPRSFRRHFTDIKPPSALRIGPIKPLSLQPKRTISNPLRATSHSKPSYDIPSQDGSSGSSNSYSDKIQTLNGPTTLAPSSSTLNSTTLHSNTPDDPLNPNPSNTNTLTRADIIRHIQLKKFLEAFIRRRKNLKTELEDRLRLLKQEAKNNRRRRQNIFFYPSAAAAAANDSNSNMNGNGMLDLQKEQRIDGLVEERIRLAHETYEQQLALLINEFAVMGLREEVLRVI